MADAIDDIYEVMLFDGDLPRMVCRKGAQLFPVGRAYGDIVQYHCQQCPHIVEKTRMELMVYSPSTGILTVDCKGDAT